MRFCSIICAGLLLAGAGCSREDSGDVAARSGASAVAESSCSVLPSEQFFKRATQVDFDYQPLSGAMVAERSVVIVKGRIESVAAGDGVTVFELSVARVYKGAIETGSHVFVAVARAPVITDKDFDELNGALPSDAVTLFLRADTTDTKPASVPAAATLYSLSSPQALIVSSACGVSQPLASEPLFAVQSEDELDTALQTALSNERADGTLVSPLGDPSVQAKLRDLALRASAAAGVPSPRTMLAVASADHQVAEHVVSGALVNDHGPVYVVVMTGGPFTTTNTSSPPPGAAAPEGEVLTLTVDAGTFRVTDVGIAEKAPDLSLIDSNVVDLTTGN